MRYTLIRPCPHCPFRVDHRGYLRPARAAEIGVHVLNGGEFPCHETTVEDEEGDLVETEASQMCAGARIFCVHERGIDDGMGGDLDLDAPVARGLRELFLHHQKG